MSDLYRVTVQVDKVTDYAEVKNRYGDVEQVAHRETTELVCGSFSTPEVAHVHDRVDAMLLAAGVSRSLLSRATIGEVEIGGDPVPGRPV